MSDAPEEEFAQSESQRRAEKKEKKHRSKREKVREEMPEDVMVEELPGPVPQAQQRTEPEEAVPAKVNREGSTSRELKKKLSIANEAPKTPSAPAAAAGAEVSGGEPLQEEDERPTVVMDSTKDLWQNIMLNVKETANESVETNVLMVGSSESGKTTLLQRVYTTFSATTAGSGGGRGGSKKVKPTTALDYSFARRTDRNSAQVAHFWELAQGTDLAQLSDVILMPECIHAMVMCVVVDASESGIGVLWETATYWLKRLDRRVSEVLNRMKGKGSNTPGKMNSRAMKIIGADHPDLSRMRISTVPTVLVVNKMDKFAGDTASLKVLAQSLRFLAHLYGAHLIFTGEEDGGQRWRSLMSHLLFQMPFDQRHIQFDPERGLVLLTADKDTFADIGEPPVTNFSSVQQGANSGDGELDRWSASMNSTFPPKQISTSTGDDKQQDAFMRKLFDVSPEGYGEPTIDALRRQKEEELELYRKSLKAKDRSQRA